MAGEAYQDEALNYADLMRNLISPPDEQQSGTSQPQQVSSVLPPTPADEPPNPTLRTRPVQRPVQPAQPAAPAVPATVSPNGNEKGPQKSWADYVRAGLDRGITASDASQNALTGITNQPTAEEQNAALIQKRAGVAQPLNPNDPEYKPGVGTRIARGIDAFRRGGVLGTVDPADVGGKAYAAPNRQYDIDTARRAQQASGIDTQISQNEAAQKADTERLAKIASEQRANATTALDIGKTASGQETNENTAIANKTKQQEADQRTRPQNDIELRVAAATEPDPEKKKQYQAALDGYIKTENKRFQYQARAQGEPNDDRRQALIDSATADVQKLNDQYDYDADTNTFFDPNSPTKTFSPREFTDMKNRISTKLDKDLTSKKLRPLGVRFNVKATTPGQQAPQAAAPAAPKAAPTAPAGATHVYKDKAGNVAGWAVDGKFVPVGAK
jgi:hypothetical protein